MSIKEAVAKLAARAEADGYKFAYIFDVGRNLAILELEHESSGVRTELS
jgi:hypothetical protein